MATIQGVNGNVADVNELARLQVQAVSRSSVEQANLDGRVFAIFYALAPAPTAAFYVYLKNLDTKDFIIKTWHEGASLTNTMSFMCFVSGDPIPAASTGSLLVTNKNGGSSKLLSATTVGAVSITGLTTLGDRIALQGHGPAEVLSTVDLTGSIVLPQGKAIAIGRDPDTGGVMTGLITVEVRE